MKISNAIREEQGVALLMVLVISAIVLAIMTAMIYMLTTSTKISGESKRYATASEAAMGGYEIARALVDHKDNFVNLTSDFSDINLQISNLTCAEKRIQNDISEWPAACSGSSIIDINDPSTYDYTFDMGDYKVYLKIAYTSEGNSHGSGDDWFQIGVSYSSGLNINKGSTTGSGGEVPVAHYEYMYTMEIDARNTKNDAERSRLSMLYQY